MNIEKMFEVAIRSKMRFPYKGLITVEDLWDLSVEGLDCIFKTLNSQIKQTKEESLLNKKTEQDEELEIQIEIVKYIVKTKIDESNYRLKLKDQKEKKQKIMEAIVFKQEADLHSKSIDELKSMLNSIDEVN